MGFLGLRRKPVVTGSGNSGRGGGNRGGGGGGGRGNNGCPATKDGYSDDHKHLHACDKGYPGYPGAHSCGGFTWT